jgi:hypothetical protein
MVGEGREEREPPAHSARTPSAQRSLVSVSSLDSFWEGGRSRELGLGGDLTLNFSMRVTHFDFLFSLARSRAVFPCCPIDEARHQICGSAHLVCDREVSSLLQEQRGDLRSTRRTCLHQGRVSTLPRERKRSIRGEGREKKDRALKIEISTAIDQEDDGITVATLTCLHQQKSEVSGGGLSLSSSLRVVLHREEEKKPLEFTQVSVARKLLEAVSEENDQRRVSRSQRIELTHLFNRSFRRTAVGLCGSVRVLGCQSMPQLCVT